MFSFRTLMMSVAATGLMGVAATAANAQAYYPAPVVSAAAYRPVYVPAATYAPAPSYVAAPTYVVQTPSYVIQRPVCPPPVVYTPAPVCQPPVVIYRPYESGRVVIDRGHDWDHGRDWDRGHEGDHGRDHDDGRGRVSFRF